MLQYGFRSRNTGKVSRTRIGACLTEYADYFRSDAFDIPSELYALIIPLAPVVVMGTYYRSLCTGSPIEKVGRVQL
jgi:hypothetical protein